jgi:hypothetical protein
MEALMEIYGIRIKWKYGGFNGTYMGYIWDIWKSWKKWEL